MKRIIILLAVSLVFFISSCDIGDTVYEKSTWKYEVTGTALTVNITMNNKNGNTVRYSSINIPWSVSFNRYNMYSFSAYISAQNNNHSGNIIVKIYRNGKEVKSATGSGAHAIVTTYYNYD